MNATVNGISTATATVNLNEEPHCEVQEMGPSRRARSKGVAPVPVEHALDRVEDERKRLRALQEEVRQNTAALKLVARRPEPEISKETVTARAQPPATQDTTSTTTATPQQAARHETPPRKQSPAPKSAAPPGQAAAQSDTSVAPQPASTPQPGPSCWGALTARRTTPRSISRSM